MTSLMKYSIVALLLSTNVVTMINANKIHERSSLNQEKSNKNFAQSKSGNKIKSSILDLMDVDILSEEDLKLWPQNHDLLQAKSSIEQNSKEKDIDEFTKLSTQEISGKSQSKGGLLSEKKEEKLLNSLKDTDLAKRISNYVQTGENIVSKTSAESFTSLNSSYYITVSNYFKQEYVQNMMMLMSLITFILLLKTLLSSFDCLNILKGSPLKEAIYVLFREVVIVLVGAVVIEALNYYDIFNFSRENSIGVSYCILVTLFLWTLLGIILVVAGHRQVKKWDKYEAITQNYPHLEKIKKQYESIYYRDQNVQTGPNFEAGLIDKIKYFIMRLIFIHPIFLPPLSESFLRKDFKFSHYLAHSYSKVLQQFFNTSWVSFLFIIIFVDMTKLIYGHEQLTHKDFSSIFLPLFNILPPIFFLGIFLSYLVNFKNIERVLYPHIKLSNGKYLKPEEINFHDNYDIVDPFVLYDNIPQPEYLEIDDNEDESFKAYENGVDERHSRFTLRSPPAHKYDQDEEGSMMLQRESDSRRSEDSEIRINHIKQWETEDKKNSSKSFGIYLRESKFGNIPNRHEMLFIGGRSGKTIARTSLQVFYLLSIIYLSTYLVFSVQKIYHLFKDSDRHTLITLCVAMTISPIVMFMIWTITIPQILTKFTIITNIEMMKDRDLIQTVINDQKLERAKRSYRIFQVLKLIRREMAMELKQHIKDKRMRGFTKKQLIEQFELLESQPTKAVRGNAIKTLIRLCGQELTNQEKNIMLKKAKSKGDQLKYKDLSLAVEMIINDVKVDPYYLVQNLFQLFFRGEEKIEYSQFITFFGEFVTYFDQEDIDAFLKEVQYIRRGSDEIHFQELASMIRDDVELFPK
eukprot:403353018